MDVMDDNGKHDEFVSLSNVHKTPLSSSGEIDKSVDPVRVQKGTALVKVGDLSLNETQIETRKANKCGDCYGAHGPLKRYKRKNEKGCCNSCKEIRMAYVHIFVSKKVIHSPQPKNFKTGTSGRDGSSTPPLQPQYLCVRVKS